MRKAKVAAITMGIIASCLGGCYVVTDAATVKLDDSVTGTPENPQPISATKNKKTAATKTSIKTTSAGIKKNAIRHHNRKLAAAPEQEISIAEIPEVQETAAPVENKEESVQEIPEINSTISEITEETEIETETDPVQSEEIPEETETTRIFVKSVPASSIRTIPAETEEPTEETPATDPVIATEPVAETEATQATDPVIATEPVAETEATQATDPVIFTKPAQTTTAKSTTAKPKTTATSSTTAATTRKATSTSASTTKATTKATTTTSTTTSTSTTTTTTTTSTTPEPIITTVAETVPQMENPEIVDVSELYLENIFDAVIEELPQEDTAPYVPEEPVQEEPVIALETVEADIPEPSTVSVSDSDYILLCNAVAHEAGSDGISIENKAKVVEVIMNRVESSSFPDTVYGVITQKSQFSGSSSYANLSGYTSKVTQNVISAVDLYFEDPSAFDHGYLYFYGDGSQNHFRQ